MEAAPLFACTKCHRRFPFDELSDGDQLCKVSRWFRTSEFFFLKFYRSRLSDPGSSFQNLIKQVYSNTCIIKANAEDQLAQ